MKQLFVSMAAMAALSLSAPAFAGGSGDCHFHGNTPAKQETVSTCATKTQQQLVANGKLEKSWQGVGPASFEQIDGQKGKEWKVTFKNPAATDKTKENLYMFFTLQGNFIAANHTGT